MKIVTVLGTRPEIIRLSRIIPQLDALCQLVLVHTGQNFDPVLSDVFFEELGVRAPDHYLGATGSFGEQIGTILARVQPLLERERPDRLLILGDTNSGLSAYIAKRLGIPVYHMEAGNRCYDDRVPEEVNRRVIDHCSDILLPYTERSRANLLREGIPGERIFVTGNPIKEVLTHYAEKVAGSRAHADHSLMPGQYVLATMHRAENVDVPERLSALVRAFHRVHEELEIPVIVSTHPRTRGRLSEQGIDTAGDGVRWVAPFGLFDFIALERNARLVLSDSGTVQEECAILRVPSVTIRDVTERPETLECGSNILSGADPESVLRCARLALAHPPAWAPPPEYMVENVSDIVTRLVLGFRLA